MQSASSNLSITINNAAPVPLQISTSSLPAGETWSAYTATLAANGGTAPYGWSLAAGALPDGLSLSAGGLITGTPTQNGSFSFTLQVADSASPASTATKAFVVSIALTGGTLQITTPSLPAAAVNVAYSTTLVAIGGITPYSWTVSSGTLPSGLKLNSFSGIISGTPTLAGSSTFTIKVQDAAPTPQTATKSFSLDVSAAASTLQITTTSLAAGKVSSAYAATITATGGTVPYTWSVSAGTLPAGLSLSASTGQISGTPTQAGNVSFTIQVKDSGSPAQTANQALSISIASNVTPVQITTSSLAGGQVGVAYSASLAASGGTTPYSWSISAGSLPAGLSLNASTGQISGTPTASGNASFTVQVKDSTSPAQTANQPLTLNVIAAIPPVSVTTSTLAGGQVGTSYTSTLAASGGTAPYSWSVSAGALPAGLTLSASGIISGTPTASGTASFTVKATDSGSPAKTATASLSLAVTAASATLQITSSTLANGLTGTVYQASFSATGGTTPYSWSVSSGSLPPGLALSSTGQITGTPTAVGSASFTVKVTDSSSPAQSATKSFSITVVSSTTPVQIVTTSLPAGQVNSGYSTSLAASGGTAPYTWSILSGSLPSGVTLAANGQISGTPTQAATSSVTIQVKDSSSTPQTASKGFSVTIATAASGTALTSCGVLSSPGTTYALQSDISSTDSCLSIQADNITINLNGHTITYATNPSTAGKARYGISVVACWDSSIASGNAEGAACGNGGNNLTVAGPGNITQGAGAAPYSHAIRIGQTDQGASPTVHDVTFNFASTSSVGIWNDFQGQGANYYNNVYNNNVTHINNRYEIEGTSIGLYDGHSQSTPVTIHNETILGGAQGAILIENPGAQVYSNTIENGNPNGTQSGGTCSASAGCQYANDFGVYAWGTQQNIYNNTITSREGRGVQVGSSSNPVDSLQLHDNVITTIEHPNNAEYNGCEIDGTYGVQLNNAGSSNPLTNNTIYNNTVLAKAINCPGFGFSWSGAMAGNTSHNNSFTCQLQSGYTSGAMPCAGIRLDAKEYTPTFTFTSTADTFTGDTSAVYTWYDGSPSWTCKQCTFAKGANALSSYVTFSWISNPGASSDPYYIIDPTFVGGASKDSNDLSGWSNGTSASYLIQWTYTLTVEKSSNSSPLSGATVTAVDSLGNSECSGTTNTSGLFSCVVTEERWYNNGSGAHQEERGPHAFTISAPACTTNKYNMTITSPTSDTRTLGGC
jgi:hypothetical protein